MGKDPPLVHSKLSLITKKCKNKILKNGTVSAISISDSEVKNFNAVPSRVYHFTHLKHGIELIAKIKREKCKAKAWIHSMYDIMMSLAEYQRDFANDLKSIVHYMENEHNCVTKVYTLGSPSSPQNRKGRTSFKSCDDSHERQVNWVFL